MESDSRCKVSAKALSAPPNKALQRRPRRKALLIRPFPHAAPLKGGGALALRVQKAVN